MTTELKEVFDSTTNKTYTMIGEELYVLDTEEDEWEPIDFDYIDDYLTMVHYVKIIGRLTQDT